jgi:hypothetical protein|tara:strand:- start:763 stop:2094 length:1332 start_codon:yes stop_codon:yes gene_type:complete
MAAITTDEQLEIEVGNLASGQPSGTPQVTAVEQNASSVADIANVSLGTNPSASTTLANPTGIISAVPALSDSSSGQISSTTNITPDLTTMDAAQITPAGSYMTDVQGTVGANSVSTAATQVLDEKATTKYQLSQLLSSIEDGTEMPAWASPAVRKVGAIMQARGLGASSMASAAMTQAVMESGVVIATQDANKYATIQLQNLNNQQQTALSNAATFAAMDKANLSARLQGAVTNAQSLLAVDTKNLDAQQKADSLTYNALTQALFKDAAEDNARKQFNAKNQLQVDEFFSELEAQVETANANRVSALAQFNAGETNAQSQFNASMVDTRDKFNANMQYAIDQSNTQWRRQVNTGNTALQNETNRLNVQNTFNASQNALNNLWQKYRDNASWNFTKSESQLQRQHEIGIMAMEFANSKEIYDDEQKDNLAAGVGNWIAAWMGSS